MNGRFKEWELSEATERRLIDELDRLRGQGSGETLVEGLRLAYYDHRVACNKGKPLSPGTLDYLSRRPALVKTIPALAAAIAAGKAAAPTIPKTAPAKAATATIPKTAPTVPIAIAVKTAPAAIAKPNPQQSTRSASMMRGMGKAIAYLDQRNRLGAANRAKVQIVPKGKPTTRTSKKK